MNMWSLLNTLVALSFAALLTVGGAACSDQSTASSPLPTAAAPNAPAIDELEAARSVAVHAVSMTGPVAAAGFTSRADLIASFATTDFAPVLLDRTNEQMRELAREFVGQGVELSSLRAVETPLTATAVATEAGVTVTVWSVLVVAITAEGPARQMWRTVTLDLIDTGSGWRVAAWASAPGPTPLPSTNAMFDDARAFEAPLSWAAATGGGR